MDPFAQAHLSELLAAARIGPPSSTQDADEYKPRTLMTFNAALSALKGVGAITDEEMADWTNRLLVALGEQPIEPLPPGTARLINFEEGGPRVLDALLIRRQSQDSSAWFPSTSPTGPWNTAGESKSFESGALQRQGNGQLEAHSITDPEALFADELAAQDPDLEGLSADFKTILRDKLIQRLQMQRRSIALTDDVGTAFRSTGGGSGGGGNERRGHSDFAPGLRSEATRLKVHWDEMEFEVPLHPDRD